MLYRGIDELLDFSEIDDSVETTIQFASLHPEDGAVEVDVLAPGQFRMKSRSHFQERTNVSSDFAHPVGWTRYAGEDLQQGAFARPVPSHNPHNLSGSRGKGNVLERPHGRPFVLSSG